MKQARSAVISILTALLPHTAIGEVKPPSKEGQAITKELLGLIAQGEALESVRTSEKLTDMKKCGDTMRNLLPKAEALKERATTLKGQDILIAGAAVATRMCVTCSKDAAFHCKQARYSLTEKRQKIYGE